MNNALTRIYTGLATGGLATIATYKFVHPTREGKWVEDCQCYATPVHGVPLAVGLAIGAVMFLATTRTMLVINRKGKK